MKYFIILGTFFLCSTLTAGTITALYTYPEVLEIARDAFKSGWDRGVNHKIVGCSIRSM